MTRLLTSPAKLWILDEVLTSLDSTAMDLSREFIGKHLQQNGIAIVATHQDLNIGAARGAEDVDEKVRRILAGDDRAAALARTITYETLIYAANRLGEIADDIVEIDRALRWGFGWERGPFETWDALGVKATADKILCELARAYGRPEEGYSRLNDPVGKETFYGGE